MTDEEREFTRVAVLGLMAELGENFSNNEAWSQVYRAVEELGSDACAGLCAEVREIEENGGLWSIADRARRTKGGVFFRLLRDRYPWARPTQRFRRKRRTKITCPEDAVARQKQQEVHRLQNAGLPWEAAQADLVVAQRALEATRVGKPTPPKPKPNHHGVRGAPTPRATLSWDDRVEAVRRSLTQKGKITMIPTTKLMGRPLQVVDKGDCFVFSLEYSGLPSIPKGLPKPPVSITYTVFVSEKQWRPVAAALAADPADQALVEGIAFWDEEMETHALLATSASTRETKRKAYADKPTVEKKVTPALAPPVAKALSAPPPRRSPSPPPQQRFRGRGGPVEVEVLPARRRPS